MIIEKYKLSDGNESYHLTAEEGHYLLRKFDGWTTREVWNYYMMRDGEKYLPKPEDFEEIKYPTIE